MSTIEFITRSSVSSLRSSQSSASRTDLHSDQDDQGWSWRKLREQFRLKKIETLFHRYQARLQHLMFVILLMMNMFFGVLFLTVSGILGENRKERLQTLVIGARCLSLTINLVIFVLSYQEKWFRPSYVRAGVATTVLLAMLLNDHLVAVVRPGREGPIRPTYYIILVTTVMLPYPRKWQSAMAASAVIILEITVSAICDQRYLQLGNLLKADIIYYTVAGMVGLYVKLLMEITNRKAFLDRRQCIESNFKIDHEKDKEEKLLLSILPKHLADSMKEDIRKVMIRMHVQSMVQRPFNDLYVKKHNHVSILYADIVNSMLLTASLDVGDLVETLNELFGRFDNSAERNDCLRISLLGDCYCCVSGVPTYNKRHAINCVQMGLDMIEIIRTVREERQVDVDMRIGVHSGNILSGILGARKWQYDIWSRDVMIASHMEQSGVPGCVHITKATLDLLNGAFKVQLGNGHLRDEYLERAQIQTFLIVGNRTENMYLKRELSSESTTDGYTKAPVALRRSSATTAPVILRAQIRSSRKQHSSGDVHLTRRKTALDSLVQYRKMVAHINQFMKFAIDEMALSKKDQWFHPEGIQPLLLYFHDWKLERAYLSQIDPLYRFYLLCVLLLFVGMTIIHVLIMSGSWYFWIVYSFMLFAIVVGCIATWTGYFWMSIKRNSAYQMRSRSFVTRVSRKVSRSIFIRIVLWFLISVLMVSCALLGLGDCRDLSFNSTLYGSNISAERYINNTLCHHDVFPAELSNTDEISLGCKFPWYYTFCAVLAMTTTTVFLRIHFMLKFTINFAALAFFCFMITREEYHVFCADNMKTSGWNDLIPSEYGHCWYLASIFITLHILERQVEYIWRLDFLWKMRLVDEQEEASKMGLINKMLLHNILPCHVAKFYLSPERKQGDKLYHETYTSVAVMFASIPNFVDFYTENTINEEGLKCLQLLNEIICDFDKQLYHPSFIRIEKIKTIGSTYMAAAGLQPGRGSTESSNQEDPMANVLSLTKFATAIMEALQYINKDALQTFRLRIGIAVGPAIAGVVGAGKPQYDIWGDTVNVASRMDSTGIMGRIQVTSEVASMLQQAGAYRCECRGKIQVKGKGLLTTYLVETTFDVSSETSHL